MDHKFYRWRDYFCEVLFHFSIYYTTSRCCASMWCSRSKSNQESRIDYSSFILCNFTFTVKEIFSFSNNLRMWSSVNRNHLLDDEYQIWTISLWNKMSKNDLSHLLKGFYVIHLKTEQRYRSQHHLSVHPLSSSHRKNHIHLKRHINKFCTYGNNPSSILKDMLPERRI